MSTDASHDELLKNVIDNIVNNNRSAKPGTPLAELQEAIEGALASLPPLQFEEFNRALADDRAAERLIRNAPEIIGWNADQIVEWIEVIAKKI